MGNTMNALEQFNALLATRTVSQVQDVETPLTDAMANLSDALVTIRCAFNTLALHGFPIHLERMTFAELKNFSRIV